MEKHAAMRFLWDPVPKMHKKEPGEYPPAFRF